MLLINADDLGITTEVTNRIIACFKHKRIHSASAMTFMKDSERAADLAQAVLLPIGLHLNLDQEFTSPTAPSKTKYHHRSVSQYLTSQKWNQILYNPFLRNSFDYVFEAQWEEFGRLYGEEPKKLDGHRHMHLCMNMLLSGKIPKRIRVRRNFTFLPGEKSILNRLYRRLVDQWLRSRFICTDAFFSMAPIDTKKLLRIISLSQSSDVELMVHPGVENEYLFLLSPKWKDLI